MADQRFFHNKGPITLKQVMDATGATIGYDGRDGRKDDRHDGQDDGHDGQSQERDAKLCQSSIYVYGQ